MEQTVKVTPAGSYEVAVCGGGIAGIAAALAAARQGKKTILFEKGYMLGGLAMAGLITIYLPLCDGYGKQVSFGIAEELFRLSIQHGAEDRYPENWLDNVGTRTEKDKRFLVRYNAQVFALLAEQILLENGVDVLYGSYVVDVMKKGDKIDTLVVESKSGRCGYQVGSVVDATGDCDVALFAGAPTDTYQEGNKLAAWYYYAGQDGFDLCQLVSAESQELVDKAKNGNRFLLPTKFPGITGEEQSEMVQLTHERTLEHFLKMREKDPSYWIATMPTVPLVRMTRKLIGEYVQHDTEMHAYFADSIGMVSDWRKRGPVYEVPFRTLYSKSVPNLIVAGRITSCTEAMWDIMRVIPCCAVTGQAAGTAAAMTDDFGALDVTALQRQLEKDGVILHEKDIPAT